VKVVSYYTYTNYRDFIDKDFKNGKFNPLLQELAKKYKNQYDDYLLLAVDEFWLSQEVIDHCTKTHGKPNAVMNNFYSKIDLDTDIPVYLIPLGFYYTAKFLLNCKIVDENEVSTVRPFNFMANRKRINRHLMIKLLEHFDLIGQAEYTWSNSDSNFDLSLILNELGSISAPWAEQVRSTILSPIGIDPRWFGTSFDVVSPWTNIQTSNKTAWDQGLNSIFNNTAVSIISESVDYQNGIGFTEKSAYPLIGLNLPIWVGGKYQAEEFEKLGFDVFSDFIDHSYQHCDTLIERCYRAIADNYKILSDIDIAAQIRQTAMPRLLKNRQLLLDTIADRETRYQKAIAAIAQLNAIDAVTDRFKLIVDAAIN
jgi:hypothetical protein